MSIVTSYAFIVRIRMIIVIVGLFILLWCILQCLESELRFISSAVHTHINYLIEWTKSTLNNPVELILMHVCVCIAVHFPM